ncbi:deoxyguanosinetriphosphate triphosphohydrolase [Polluticoccus soli]|uniref:deoxyguanosinetriphosphate triphosphohydrolase n=1 Tax=Polluticoccus soli TaxID=3034150 RepID=UPI0023E23D3B|nr:deoxyguanosinetriphosphate triphosphohydrolase [Flavipsychrobacter sp. JY13-12]
MTELLPDYLHFYTMNWASLYSAKRTGDRQGKTFNPDQVRNSFLRDYDRIIFSSAFRRLQNKTQVFPLPRAVFVHNRLTHSLEVASVGRSLGKSAGDALAEKYGPVNETFAEFYKYELPSVIAAACLAHDIGNPPFGHSGEDAIRTYFTTLEGDSRKMVHDALSENQLKDLEKFEGNSNAFRILTNNFNEIDPGGYRLTYATLASIVKYPCASVEGFNKSTGLIATKKSGFFDSELDVYKQIAAELEIPKTEGFEHVYSRHPFVFLTEAADDICYRIIDMEDAHRLHILTLYTIKELFYPFFEKESEYYNTLEYLDKKVNSLVDDNQKVQFIRAKWIGLMTEKLSKAFMDNEEALLAGTLQKDLMKCLPKHEQELIDRINDFSYKYIYNYKSVVEIEIAGYNVIGGLLKEFVHAVLYHGQAKSGKLLQLVSKQFPLKLTADSLYSDIQSIVDFISGMTDLYAIDMYRKITGINVPEIR